jgi:O-antigen ligase
MAVGAGLIALVVLIQLVPLPRSVVARISPATNAFVQQYDIHAIAAASPPVGATLGIEPGTFDLDGSRPLTVNSSDTSRGLLFVTGLSMFLLGMVRGLDRRDVRFLIVGLTMLGVALSLSAIIQRALSARIYGFWQPSDAGRSFGSFVNPNHFAGWLLMALPLAAGYALAKLHEDRQRFSTLRQQVLWIASPAANAIILVSGAVAIMALTLVFTLSRSGMISLIAALFVMGCVVARRSELKSARRTTLAFLVATVITSFGWVGVDRIAGEFLYRDPGGLALGGRQLIWQDTTRIIRDFPLFGTGFNTYQTAMLQYETPRDFSAVEAHSDYLQIVAEGGSLLMAVVLVCTAIFVVGVGRRFREQGSDHSGYWIRLGAVVGLLGIALQETVEFSLQIPGNAVLFCLLAAVALSDLRREPPAKPRRSNVTAKLELAFMGATLATAVLAGVVAFRAGGPYGESASNRRLYRGYDVQAKRLTQLFYDANGNGVFDIWIDLRNPADVVVEKDANEDGLPESLEHFGTRTERVQ